MIVGQLFDVGEVVGFEDAQSGGDGGGVGKNSNCFGFGFVEEVVSVFEELSLDLFEAEEGCF